MSRVQQWKARVKITWEMAASKSESRNRSLPAQMGEKDERALAEIDEGQGA